MVVRKFNYYRFFAFIAILLGIIFFTCRVISKHNYKKTYDYKLSEIGYNERETEILKNNLSNNELDKLLTKKYNREIVGFVKEKYFIYKNLDDYLDYKNSHKSDLYNDIVSIVNTEANKEWIDNQKETDISKGSLMLVNRIYGLKEDYEPDDIITVPAQYAYSGVKISNSILENITNMIDAAKKEGYTFVLSDGYRSYKTQSDIYDTYKRSYGERAADNEVARPGHSEYQTGISFTIVPYNKAYDESKDSEEYTWLQNNAHKYGFIFRFTADKTKLTGFGAFTWRLRYVGTEAASVMYQEKICFEEYYAYYIDKE